MLNAHVQSVGSSELERREFGGQVLAIIDSELRQSQPIRPGLLFFGTEQP